MASSPLITLSIVCSEEIIVSLPLEYRSFRSSKARLTSAGVMFPFQKSSKYNSGVDFAIPTRAENRSRSLADAFVSREKSRQERYRPFVPCSTIARNVDVQSNVFPQPGRPDMMNQDENPVSFERETYVFAIFKASSCHRSGVCHWSKVQPSRVFSGSPLFFIAAIASRMVMQRHGR